MGIIVKAAPLLLVSVAAMGQVNITIDPSELGIAVSPTLNGIFYEDINHASDGGIYAELVRNRSFEEMDEREMMRRARRPEGDDERPALPDGFEPDEDFLRELFGREGKIQAWDAVGNAELSLTTDGLLNDKQGHALVLDVKEAGAGAQNEGYWGMKAVNGMQYKLSLWVKALAGKPGALDASLVDSAGRRLASVRLTDKLTGKWQKLEATMVAEGDDAKAHFELTAEQPCRLALDVVSLFPPTYKNRPNGCRTDLAEMLAAMKPKFMRFPGGCFVEGMHTPESAFRWERTVGPIEERPGHYGTNWHYWVSDGMGFHEFLQLAEDLGAKPLYVVNVGIWHGGSSPVEELDTTWIKECLDALEYANGGTDTNYGRMRADNGHPEPFNIEYLEIGNENANYHFNDDSDQSNRYFERYAKFYAAVRERYPDMKIIGNTQGWSTDHPSWRSSEPVDILDEHYYRDPSWFVKAYTKYDNYDRQGPDIYAGEYAVTSQFGTVGNLNAALGEAVYMLGMENNSDIVTMNSYAPLFVNENAYNWPANLIHFDSGKAFGTPSYWVQQLFSTHVGNRIVKQTLEYTLPEAPAPKQDARPLRVGVSTWGTRATFKDATLTLLGEEAQIPDITQWASTQKTPSQREDGPRRMRARQQWEVDEEEMTASCVGAGEGVKWMCPTEITAPCYSFAVKAKKTWGGEGFLVVFNYKNERDFDWLNIGGWGNTMNAIEQSVDGGRITLTGDAPFEVEQDRWYDVRVDVQGDSIAAYVDGELQFATIHRSADMHGVYSNTTLDEATQTLYIKVVNLGPETATASANLVTGAVRSAQMTRLASASGQDENSMGHPLNVMPRPANVDINGDGSRLDFEVTPHSLSIIVANLK